MAEIIKVYRESLPELRLIGKRYVDGDRGKDGGFNRQWEEWFQRGWFKPLEALGCLPANGDAYVGCMRCAGEFEYWIGMFFPRDTSVPDGYSYADISAGDIGTCWIYGRAESGELYGQGVHDACVAKIRDEGWQLADNGWFFERYNCRRFTTPDETSNVILDYCMYLNDK